ncbi:MAG TPA: ABC transporter permease [Vicinamibacterales bacterium]|nr:ABC transporter permease [Vicinamibacterales bacterium]
MLEDLKAAVRSLVKSPTFTAVALTVLALGIGSGTAIFSVVDAVVLRGLPFEEHDRIAVVLEHDPTRAETFGGGSTTPQTYLDWRRLQQSFEGLAAVGSTTYRLRTESGEPGDARGQRVTWEFFPALRVAPVLGRSFTADDEIEGRHRIAILSYGFWQRRYGGAADVVGKTIDLNEESWEIVGVMPRRFSYPVASDRPSEIYTPIAFRAEEKTRADNRNYNWTIIGRLKAGVTIEQAHENMSSIAAALDQQYPKWSPGRRARVISLHHHLVGRVRSWMLLLLGSVALVLLIACANVANLMLARATARTREMGIRAALGAGRWRLVRGLLVEGLVLSLAGAAAGVLLAYLGVEMIRAWLPATVPRVAAIGIDLRVLGATVAAAVVTGVTFGLLPAFHSSRPDLTTALKDTGRSTTAGRSTQWLRNALVVAEVALAVVLLAGSGLFIGSFAKLMRVNLGLDPHNVLVLNVGVRVVHNDFREAMKHGNAYVEQMLAAVRAVPGVQDAAAVSGGLPLTGSWSRTGIEIPGRPKADGDNSIDRRLVTPNYLQLLRIPLIKGRYLTDQDRNGPMVMVINETAARIYWPNQDPIGQRATINSKERTIVGIVGDIRHLGPETPPRQEAYIPFTQEENTGATLVMRTAGDPLKVLPAAKAAIWSVNREQRLSADTVTLDAYMGRLVSQRRFNMAMIGLFGALGLVIAAVGVYGVMTYLVAQRTNEIGVRMALGATRGNVVSMILKRAALLLVAGLAIGTAVAYPLSSALQVQRFLFQVEPTDVAIYTLAAATLAVAGLVASAIPARRAASIDPLAALRHE